MTSNKKDICIQFGVEETPYDNGSEIIEREWRFTEPDNFSDLKLVVDCKKFYCHKIMLSNCSPVFKAMLSGNFIEKSADEIEIKDTYPESMEVLLQSIYNISYKCTNEKDSVMVLPLADRYQITHIIKEVENYLFENLMVNSDKCMEYLKIVKHYNLPRVRQMCLDIMSRASNNRYLSEIKDSEELKEFENELLRTRVKSLEEILKNIELSLSNPCSRVEKKEIRVPVNFCLDHQGPLALKESGEHCAECIKKLKTHIKNVCTTEKIRTTINLTRDTAQ